jgi:hypothetical protein
MSAARGNHDFKINAYSRSCARPGRQQKARNVGLPSPDGSRRDDFDRDRSPPNSGGRLRRQPRPCDRVVHEHQICRMAHPTTCRRRLAYRLRRPVSRPTPVAAGAWRAAQCAERLLVQGIGDPVVVHEAGQDCLALARLLGDRAAADVVLAGFRAGVAAGIVTELAENPAARTWPRPGWLR